VKNKTRKSKKLNEYKLGDKHFIDGVECAVFHINNGDAWLAPTFDSDDEPLVARHIAYAKLTAEGEIVLI